MKFFKDSKGTVYAFEADGSQDDHIPSSLVSITKEEADALRFPSPSTADLIAAITAAIQAELDRRAAARGYDNIVSACSYAAQPQGAPFQAEGAAFLACRSQVWSKAYADLADVEAGKAPMPTPQQAVASMPALVLPD